MDNQVLTASVLVITQAAIIHPTIMPDLGDIRNCAPDQGSYLHKSIRCGQGFGGLLIILVGALAGSLVKSTIPFWVGVASAVLMCGAYEGIYRWVS